MAGELGDVVWRHQPAHDQEALLVKADVLAHAHPIALVATGERLGQRGRRQGDVGANVGDAQRAVSRRGRHRRGAHGGHSHAFPASLAENPAYSLNHPRIVCHCNVLPFLPSARRPLPSMIEGRREGVNVPARSAPSRTRRPPPSASGWGRARFPAIVRGLSRPAQPTLVRALDQRAAIDEKVDCPPGGPD